jgi:hypothetical protein
VVGKPDVETARAVGFSSSSGCDCKFCHDWVI